MTLSLGRKILDFFLHTRCEALVSVLQELLLLEVLRVLALCKISKEEGELG